MCETAHLEASMEKYSIEQIYAAIDAAVEAFGLEGLKHQQREAICEFVNVFVALTTGFGKAYSSTYYVRPSACSPSIIACTNFSDDGAFENVAATLYCRS